MKVLFVSSGNNKNGISPIVKAQGESLANEGIEMHYFPIIGKGLSGYLKNILKLKHFLKSNSFDIIHSHYSLAAFVTSLASVRPHVVSLMGSDVKARTWNKWVIRLFNALTWDFCIVKSEEMRMASAIKNAEVIPNGVDLNVFKPMDKEVARTKLGLDNKKGQILFAADPERYEKNFNLARKAVRILNRPDKELCVVFGIPHAEMQLYLNSSDLLLLTSKWEGSPNIIKEAMACNCPVVSTDVGDVRWLMKDVEGCYIAPAEEKIIAEKIAEALSFGKRTEGRKKIIELGLDSVSASYQILQIYKKVLNRV